VDFIILKDNLMAKWSIYDVKIKKVLLKNNFGGQYIKVVDAVSKGLSTHERKHLSKYIRDNHQKICGKKPDANFDNETTTQINDYQAKSFFTAISATGGIMDIQTYCKHYSLDYDKVKSWKLVSHTGVPFYNIAFYESGEEIAKEIDFTTVFKEWITPAKVVYNTIKTAATNVFDRLVYTDVHVGMNVNPDGYSLYGGIWDKDEIFRRLDIMIKHVILHKKSNILHIDELGDFADGWDGETTRKGHKLPQNMDNQAMYDVGVSFKVYLIDRLIPYFDKIICHNICEDNHAGAFGYVINSAFKTIMELKYPQNVEVVNQRKFIDHYFATPKHCFPLTHGKDSKSLKFGFKPILDKIQENKIDNYIKEHYLMQKGVKIEFCKGDSHQYITDNSTSKSFSYNNFPAFSPPSGWVQINFQNSISGFVSYNYYDNGQKSINDHIFE
jgi:hypothetical protein